jgi:hypothetical protein
MKQLFIWGGIAALAAYFLRSQLSTVTGFSTVYNEGVNIGTPAS